MGAERARHPDCFRSPFLTFVSAHGPAFHGGAAVRSFSATLQIRPECLGGLLIPGLAPTLHFFFFAASRLILQRERGRRRSDLPTSYRKLEVGSPARRRCRCILAGSLSRPGCMQPAGHDARASTPASSGWWVAVLRAGLPT